MGKIPGISKELIEKKTINAGSSVKIISSNGSLSDIKKPVR